MSSSRREWDLTSVKALQAAAAWMLKKSGAMLVIVTKGVTQSRSGKIPFGAERIIEVLRNSKQESAKEVCREMLEAAHRFEKGRWYWLAFWRKKVSEDMTALAMVRSRQVD